MDQDRDGTISVDDLKEVYNSLGKNLSMLIRKHPIPVIWNEKKIWIDHS